jgi:SPOR domain
MADEQNQNPYRSNETPARGAPGTTAASGSDPLAELARLIGQTDPFAEFGRDSARRPAAPPPAPQAPPAAPAFGANEYSGAATAPSAVPVAPAYGTPSLARQPYGNAAYAANADLYHTETEAPGYAATPAGGYETQPYPHDLAHHDGEDEHLYDDVPPVRRRMGIMALAAVFALAVLGTAGALGYRALFGSSAPSQPPPVIKADSTPSKIVPASANKTPNKLITDRVTDHTQNEKLVSRQEQPVELNDRPAGAAMAPNNVQPNSAQPMLGSGVITAEPKKIRTIAIHPDQAGMGQNQPMAATPPAPPPPARMANPAPVHQAAPPPRVANNPPAETRQVAAPVRHAAAAPSPNAPLSLSPNAPVARAPMRTAAAAAPAPIARAAAATTRGGYAVQVSSQRSEADAQASFRSLQAKFPNQLGGRQVLIHKVELGAKGTYYRAMVGPFANAGDASALCSSLKAAGGSCLIQRN